MAMRGGSENKEQAKTLEAISVTALFHIEIIHDMKLGIRFNLSVSAVQDAQNKVRCGGVMRVAS